VGVKKMVDAFPGPHDLQGGHLRDMGFNVESDTTRNFFTTTLEHYQQHGILVSNPPFSKLNPILKHLKVILFIISYLTYSLQEIGYLGSGLPFILLIDGRKSNNNYFKDFLARDKVQYVKIDDPVYFLDHNCERHKLRCLCYNP
jgi:hypothetical protein